MGTKLNKVPTNETELNKLLQDIYLKAKQNYDDRKESNFTGIMEIITSEPNIVTAIHRIKGKKGSKTPGTDGKVIDDYMRLDYKETINLVRETIRNYRPDMVKRAWMPKPGTSEQRPIGIPTIIDRIVQECFRKVLEPIAEGQFFEHSYGYRPMRSPDMAVARIKRINFTSKCCWAVKGDIKSFFDTINHNVMMESLWNCGIRDRRVLSIIKQMLKAGIMDECKTSELGTPQGGIISPLLANIYLSRFDNYMTGDFERKRLRTPKTRRDGELTAMRNHSNLKTCYYVRYADDWVILTDNKEDAEKLKYKAKKYLQDTLKLELSEEKTLIINVRKKPIKFLGTEIRMTRKNGVWVNRVTPDRDRFKTKMKELRKEIFYIRKTSSNDKDRLVQNITRVNAITVGLMNYYSMCDQISVFARRPGWALKYTAYKSLKRFGGEWVRAKNVNNLIGLHNGRNTNIPAIRYQGKHIGITDLAFASWNNPIQKNQGENPFTREGRELHNKRMRRKGLKARTDEVNSVDHALYIRMNKGPLYNFEYYMNRPYAYSRDMGKCKICNGFIEPDEARFHHVDKRLPRNMVNRVSNLITIHQYCHELIHSEKMPESLSDETIKKIVKYRKMLNGSDTIRK